VSENESRPLYLFDNIGNGECLSASSDAKKHLFVRAFVQPSDKLFDRLRLIACGLVFRNETELHTLNHKSLTAQLENGHKNDQNIPKKFSHEQNYLIDVCVNLPSFTNITIRNKVSLLTFR
jgi:hypothetical protein